MQQISSFSLFLSFIPALLVIFYFVIKKIEYKTSLYAMARMILQLIMIGYLLIYIFKTQQSWIVFCVLTVMLIAAGWIALRTVPHLQRRLFAYAFASIFVGGGFTLIVITQLVLDLRPWFAPDHIIPLAGMIFANAMIAISLSAERLYKELKMKQSYEVAFNDALFASLIPITNSLFAVGLVSLPGMMTGQILSGISPLIAARYQMMVMAMIFGASGLSVILFLRLSKKVFESADSK